VVDGGLIELRWFGPTPPWRDLLAGLGRAQGDLSKPASHVVLVTGRFSSIR
jgi:hypothetical protein